MPSLVRHDQPTAAALKTGQVPAVGFVNEATALREGKLDPARVELLRSWLKAGFELGNHTASHPSLNRVPLDASRPICCRAKPSRAADARRRPHPALVSSSFPAPGHPPEVRVAFRIFSPRTATRWRR